MTKNRILTGCLIGLTLATTACSAANAPAATTTGPSTVVFLGDSVAEGEAIPLGTALKASGANFQSLAADGGGNVVGPFSDKNWAKLPGQLTAANPNVVVYQITTYDWGSPQEQHDAYTKLRDTVVTEDPNHAALLDATTVWGPAYQQVKDGKADRSADGIHTCPQGAARFTSWLVGELAKLTPGLTPAAASQWANTGWSEDKRFQGC